MTNKNTFSGNIASNILVLFAGALITVIILGVSSGILTSWIKSILPTKLALNPSPSPSVEPVATVKTSPTPTPSNTPEPSYKPTTKGGIVLGENDEVVNPKPVVKNNYSYATVVYEYKDRNSNTWLIRGNYDTRYESYIDFDAVSSSYDRKVTICLFSANGTSRCENGKVEPAVYTYNYLVAGKKLVYEIVGDKNGPTISFEGPWKNNEGKTCVKVTNISDNLTPQDRLIKAERMDEGVWRDVHSEYCIGGNQFDTHRYQVRAKDENGNETTSTYTFQLF